MDGTKGERREKWKKDQGKRKNPSAIVRFSEIENGTRNPALSTTQMGISEENGANFAAREFLISSTGLCKYEWGSKIGALIQQLAIARVLSIPVSTAAPYVVLTGCVNIRNIRIRFTL